MKEKYRHALLRIRKAGKSRTVLLAYAKKRRIGLAVAEKDFRAVAQFICAATMLDHVDWIPSTVLARVIRAASSLPGFDDWRSELDPRSVKLARSFSPQIKRHYYLIVFEFASQLFGRRALKSRFWPRLPPVRKLILSREDMVLGPKAESETM